METPVDPRRGVRVERTPSRFPACSPPAEGLGEGAPPSWVVFESAFVNLYSHDVDAGLRFYRNLLGLKETFRTPKQGTPEHVELSLHGFGLALSSVEAAKRVHGVDARPGSPVMSVVVWADDEGRVFHRVASAGTSVAQRPHNTGNNNRNALLREPNGNLVEIVSKVT